MGASRATTMTCLRWMILSEQFKRIAGEKHELVIRLGEPYHVSMYHWLVYIKPNKVWRAHKPVAILGALQDVEPVAAVAAAIAARVACDRAPAPAVIGRAMKAPLLGFRMGSVRAVVIKSPSQTLPASRSPLTTTSARVVATPPSCRSGAPTSRSRPRRHITTAWRAASPRTAPSLRRLLARVEESDLGKLCYMRAVIRGIRGFTESLCSPIPCSESGTPHLSKSEENGVRPGCMQGSVRPLPRWPPRVLAAI